MADGFAAVFTEVKGQIASPPGTCTELDLQAIAEAKVSVLATAVA